MNQLSLSNSPISDIQVIASSGPFQIELLKHVGENDYSQLILISKTLEEDYGKKAILTHETIQKYFNKEGALPFIARYQKVGAKISRLHQGFGNFANGKPYF